jgi:hypothetical protein
MQQYVRIERSSDASVVALRAAACAIAIAIALAAFLPWIEPTSGVFAGEEMSLFELTFDDQFDTARPYRDLAFMLSGLLLVFLTCAGSTRPSDERRRAIGRGAAFSLVAIPACVLVLGTLLFDEATCSPCTSGLTPL